MSFIYDININRFSTENLLVLIESIYLVTTIDFGELLYHILLHYSLKEQQNYFYQIMKIPLNYNDSSINRYLVKYLILKLDLPFLRILNKPYFDQYNKYMLNKLYEFINWIGSEKFQQIINTSIIVYNESTTLLNLAVIHNNVELIKILLDNGAIII